MNKYVEWYFNHIKEILDKVFETQADNIDTASSIIADAIELGNQIFAFGASHAGILVEELFYRAGGLALINPIFNPTLMLNTRPVTLTSKMERLEGFGKEIINSTPIKEGDVLIIHSVSGRNYVAIDMALEAKKIDAKIIVITNLVYSKKLSSRHSSGKMLYELGDVVIDNCGDFEDASTLIEGMNQKVAPTSTAVGAVIVNAIIISIVYKLIKKGITPPIFHSANVDGGDEFNRMILTKYKDRIHYM
ncbi:SIS domain-containing protein [Caloramator sp. CAR-1]|uniref:SIS domain-containing protein n=1 Tax=Caloramator sp. CAR-1 TaxID=3062777 RepID=UPI0026E270C8|nr:SIS domain-containing protein [Caloramator sp. CAR-1]MDO6354903.1 SIS domain-containing protein [Caloramator sp. CAR-1]